jgi:hypothetical protein
LFDKKDHTKKEAIDTALYRLFPNYAGLTSNALGTYPLSFLELSRPTGRYVSRFLLRELNLLIRKHSILMIGNNCVPGYFFPKLENQRGLEQFFQNEKAACSVFIANVAGHNENIPGAVVFQSEPFMYLTLEPEWQNTNDYLQAMQSKYRVRTKKVLATSAGLTMQRFNGESLDSETLATCAAMLQHTLREKTLAMNKNLSGILQCFAEHFGSDFILDMYYLKNEPVGFITCTIADNQLIAWHLGYHADIAKETHIYQRMLFDLIDLGIQRRVGRIHFGRTATEIKSTLGAEPLDNQFVVFSRNRILLAMLRHYKKFHFRPKEYVIRRPFK